MLLVISYIVFSILAVLIGFAVYGPGVLQKLQTLMTGDSVTDLYFLKTFLGLTSIGTFIIPPLLLKFIERNRSHYLNFAIPSPRLLLLALAIMLVSSPFLELTSIINKQMQLPGFLSELETWMKVKELEMERVTESILQVTTFPGLLFNLLVIAIIPAIGEEFLFRGCLQPILYRWTKNIHVAIWLTAILFSAIHVQFYGFIPRMMMGAAFGYMLFWGRSIWLPVTAHFLNNAAAVIYTFVLLKQGKTFEEINGEPIANWLLYIVSIALLGFCIYQYWKQSRNPELQTENNTQT